MFRSQSADQFAVDLADTYLMHESTIRRPKFSLFGVLCLGVLSLGLVTAAVLTGGPRRSAATPDTPPIVPPPNIDWAARETSEAGPAEPGRLLCELIGVEFRVRVFAAPDEPRYTVLSLDGTPLLELATLTEIAQAFPTLNLDTMKDAEGKPFGPLMLMDNE